MARSDRNISRGLSIGLALAGGGSKAFYSLGLATYFMEQGVGFQMYAGTSAGSAIALSLATGKTRDTLEYFARLVEANQKNFYFTRLLRGKSPFPHLNMYRRGIQAVMDFDRLREVIGHTRFRIPAVMMRQSGMFRPSSSLSRAYLLLHLAVQYRREVRGDKRNKALRLMEKTVQKYKLREVVFTEKDFTSPEMVEKIILVSSSAPPIIRTQKIGPNFMLDGGLTSNLPLGLLDDVDLKVGIYYLKSTYRKALEEQEANQREKDYTIIFGPRFEIPIATFEYTDGPGIRQTFEQGYQDGPFYFPLLENRIRELRAEKGFLKRSLRRIGF